MKKPVSMSLLEFSLDFNRRVIGISVMNVDVQVGKVFCDEKGSYGNPVGIVEDMSSSYNNDARIRISHHLGFSETVFINDLECPAISIFTKSQEIAFAGHAAVGAVSFFEKSTGCLPKHVNCLNGLVRANKVNDLFQVEASEGCLPPWQLQYQALKELEVSLPPQDIERPPTVFWSWLDEHHGHIRARTFAAAWGILEDEANGSGCMRLAIELDRPLIIQHGRGSWVYTEPIGLGNVSVGGRVVWGERRSISI